MTDLKINGLEADAEQIPLAITEEARMVTLPKCAHEEL